MKKLLLTGLLIMIVINSYSVGKLSAELYLNLINENYIYLWLILPISFFAYFIFYWCKIFKELKNK